MGEFPWGELLFLILGALWLTFWFGGFAYCYWFVGILDPRDPFANWISDLGAILVFPFGWIVALWGLLENF